jgi:hypothetical protein
VAIFFIETSIFHLRKKEMHESGALRPMIHASLSVEPVRNAVEE